METLQSNALDSFIDENHDVFRDQDSVTLTQAWQLYTLYCEDVNLPKTLTKFRFREELKNYFEVFEARGTVDGEQVRNIYKNFKGDQA